MSQIFCYSPRSGAYTVDTTGLRFVDTRIPDGTNSPNRCPQCGQGHGITGVWGSLADKPEKICPSCEQKGLDKKTSLGDNSVMCKQVKFVTAVALAIQDVRSSPFSAFNVTQKLREWVNKGDVAFTDKSPETIDGVGTYRVDHQEVRDTLRELIKNSVIQGLDMRDTGRFIEYFEVSNAPVTCVSPTPSAPPPNPRAGHTPLVAVAQATPLPADADLLQKLQDYLKGRAGQDVTMKEVQSRFKGINKTCREWGDLVSRLGIPVDTVRSPSFWTTRI